MKLLLIRHGMTAGNRDKRYIGRTDEPLCDEGIQMLRQQAAAFTDLPEVVFVSPMQRCRQTADLLFPRVRQVVIDDLKEMDFGIFENRAYQGDLEFLPEYVSWLETWCEAPIPEGESKNDFSARCRRGFEEVMRLLEQEAGQKPQEAGQKPSEENEQVVRQELSEEVGQTASQANEKAMPQESQHTVAHEPTAAIVVHGGTIMAIMDGFAKSEKAYYEWNAANGHGYAVQWDGTAIREIEEI